MRIVTEAIKHRLEGSLEVNPNREIRNSDGYKACILDEDKKTVEIKLKNCITRIKWLPNGEFEIVRHHTW